jgi:hypothetical protein
LFDCLVELSVEWGGTGRSGVFVVMAIAPVCACITQATTSS